MKIHHLRSATCVIASNRHFVLIDPMLGVKGSIPPFSYIRFKPIPNEPTIYISGDTVYTPDVERALSELKPDIAIMAAGTATLDVSKPILMPMDELLRFVRTAPGIVVRLKHSTLKFLGYN